MTIKMKKEKFNRRDFVKNSILMAGTAALGFVSSGEKMFAHGNTSDKHVQKKKLVFKKDGKFKIVQFTDIHWKPAFKESEEAMVAMNNVLDAEKPDLVIYTGDHVTGHPVRSGLDVIFKPVLDRKLPFAFVFGNHDNEFGMTLEEIYNYLKDLDGNLTNTTEGISGVTNFTLPIYSAKNEKVASVIYCLDSNFDVNGVDGFYKDQVEWYTQQSTEFTRQNGGAPLPSLAYFHIPLPEYQEALSDRRARFYGVRKEAVAYQKQNAGMFTAFQRGGDIMGTFSGHDHLNDFVICWKKTILLCYGRVTGSRRTSHYNLPNGSNGARVVELTEGERGFDSWIRLRTGEKIQSFKYPLDFVDD